MHIFRCCGLAAAVAVGLAVSRPAVAHVDLITPNGGELLDAGSVFTVAWKIRIAHDRQDWDLWYSTSSSSGPWIEMARDLPPGSGAVGSVHRYDWTIPNIVSENTWARVRMDNTATDYYDVSDASFAIVSKPAADLTGNGFVDFDDLAILLTNWDQDVGAALGNLVSADDTVVNFDDLAVLLTDWTGPDPAGSPPAALGAESVPEPSAIVLAVMAALGIAVSFRQRRRK